MAAGEGGGGAKLATGWYELIPSMAGAEGSIASQLMPAAGRAGGSAGASMGAMLLGGLKRFAGPIAIIAAGFSIKKIVHESTEAFMGLAAETKNLQRLTGGTVEQASLLGASMRLSGLDTTKTSTAMAIFSRNLNTANDGGDKTNAMVAKLGTNFRDAHGNILPISQIMPGLADRFKSMPDGAQKTALAMQLFGRSGAQMLPFLNKGSAGLAELNAKAREMGLVLDDTSLRIFTQAKVSMREYQATVQGTKVALGQDLVPILESVSNVGRQLMIPVLETMTGWFAKARTPILGVAEDIQGFADRGGHAMKGILGFFQGGNTIDLASALGITASSPIVSVLNGVRDGLQGAFGFVKTIFADIGPVVGPLIGQFAQLWSTISPLGIVFKSLQPILPALASMFTTLAQTVGGALGGVMATLMPVLQQVAGTLVGALTTALQALLPVLPPIIGVIGNLAGMLAGALGNALSAILPVIGSLISTLVTALVPVVQRLAPVIVDFANALGPILGQVLQAIAPIITMVADTLGQILPIITPLLDPIFQLFGILLPLATPILKLVGALLTPLIQLLGAILTPILGLISPILDLLVPVLTFLVQILAAVIQGVVGAITWFVNLVTGSKEAQAQLASVWSAVAGFFSGLWNTIVGFFSTGISRAIAFVTGLPKMILNALGNLGSVLYNAGRDLIQGLLNGAGSLLKNIGKFFLSILPSWIVDPFKAALGIHSPSTVMADESEHLPEGVMVGVTRGVNKNRGAVAASLASMVQPGSFLSGMAGSARAAISAASGGLPGTITLLDQDGSILTHARVMVNGAIAGADAANESTLRGSFIR